MYWRGAAYRGRGPARGNGNVHGRGGRGARGSGGGEIGITPRALTLTERMDRNNQKIRFLEKLSEIQKTENCNTDIEPFVEPFIGDSLINMIRGETVVGLFEYLGDLKGKVVCGKCHRFGHVTSLCSDKKERCGRCFHVHSPTATCHCPHTRLFLEWCAGQFDI